MRVSVRNQLKGTIVSITEGEASAIVVMDIGGGVRIASHITNDAVRGLGLKEGLEAYAIIRASSVMVGVDD